MLLQELPDSKQCQADEQKVCTYKDDIPANKRDTLRLRRVSASIRDNLM